MPSEETIFHKLGDIPVLNEGWTTAWDYYAKVKDYNSLTLLTLNVAESGVKVAGKISTPVVTPFVKRYRPQIDSVNEYACKKLDELENKYPVIKESPEQVKVACTEYIEPIVGRVKPVVQQVQGIVDTSKKQVECIKNRGTNMISDAKDLGIGTVSHVVTATFDTAPGRFVTRTMDGVLDKADQIVDKYLPEEVKETVGNVQEDKDDESMDSSEDGENVEQMTEMEPTPQRVTLHFRSVSEKLCRRVYRMALRDLRSAKISTIDSLIHMKNTVKLIDFAKLYLSSAQEKVEVMYKKISEKSEQENGSIFAGTLEDRIIALGSVLADKIKSGISGLEKASSELGHFVQNPISKTKEYADIIQTFSIMPSVQDFSVRRLEQVNASLRFIQNKVEDMINMAVDIDMNGMELQENDLGIEQVVSSNNNSEDEQEREEAHPN